MYATCIDTCSTLIYINYIHIQVRGGGGGGGGGPDPPDPPPCVRPCFKLQTRRLRREKNRAKIKLNDGSCADESRDEALKDCFVEARE